MKPYPMILSLEQIILLNRIRKNILICFSKTQNSNFVRTHLINFHYFRRTVGQIVFNLVMEKFQLRSRSLDIQTSGHFQMASEGFEKCTR